MVKISSRKIFKIGLMTTCSAAIFTWTTTTFAADTDVSFGLKADTEYTDNRFYTETNKQSVFTYRISPSLTMLFEEEGSNSSLTAHGSYLTSSDKTIVDDRFNYGVNFSGNYQQEVSTVSLGLGYNRVSVFESEFEDTGVFFNDANRDRGNADISIAYQMNENWTFRLSDNFQLLNYRSDTVNLANVFRDYWSNNAGIGLDWAFNERTAITTDFSYLYLNQRNDLLPDLNSYSALAGIRHDLTENTTISLSGGVTYSDDEYRWSAIAAVNHEIENYIFTIRAAREMVPSGIGGLRLTESFTTGMTYQYSESVSMGTNGSWRKSETIDLFAFQENEFFEFSPWISFQIIEDLRLRLSYQLRRQRRSPLEGWGTANNFYISLVY